MGLRIVERVHGHLGVLSVATLLHPAIVLRHAGRRAHLAVFFAAFVPALTAAIGVWLYGPYRSDLKRLIFVESSTMGLMFERKEHLAFGAVALAWAGALTYVAGCRRGDARVARAAHVAFICSFVLSLAVAVLGVAVASFKSF